MTAHCYVAMAVRSAGGGGSLGFLRPGPERCLCATLRASYMDCEIASKRAYKRVYMVVYILLYIEVVVVFNRWILKLPAYSRRPLRGLPHSGLAPPYEIVLPHGGLEAIRAH